MKKNMETDPGIAALGNALRALPDSDEASWYPDRHKIICAATAMMGLGAVRGPYDSAVRPVTFLADGPSDSTGNVNIYYNLPVGLGLGVLIRGASGEESPFTEVLYPSGKNLTEAYGIVAADHLVALAKRLGNACIGGVRGSELSLTAETIWYDYGVNDDEIAPETDLGFLTLLANEINDRLKSAIKDSGTGRPEQVTPDMLEKMLMQVQGYELYSGEIAKFQEYTASLRSLWNKLVKYINDNDGDNLYGTTEAMTEYALETGRAAIFCHTLGEISEYVARSLGYADDKVPNEFTRMYGGDPRGKKQLDQSVNTFAMLLGLALERGEGSDMTNLRRFCGTIDGFTDKQGKVWTKAQFDATFRRYTGFDRNEVMGYVGAYRLNTNIVSRLRSEED